MERLSVRDFYASTSRSEADMVQGMKRMSVREEAADDGSEFKCAVSPPDNHDNLVHGMSCGLCRNNYWLYGFVNRS